MPREIERDGICWSRPWLDREPQGIAAYVRRHRLRHIEDDSNADARFARNRLRLQVWPALEQAFPQAEAALAASAAWAQQAAACLGELATLDLKPLIDERGLAIEPWLGLSEARRTNALRHWLAAQLGRAAPASLVLRLSDELPGSSRQSGRSRAVRCGSIAGACVGAMTPARNHLRRHAAPG
ncbi:hypothetical protein FSC37_09735 [Piscinibacter aquaticus]|uniref:tRNA(Ile)-2-lysyl-cytidine synthase n=1 Tax=Piscinibacter aquaticus TaxID=392597 RepID=A0A5C6TZJ7_9BURK|nr:hypothetical protein FSC37_09735 [Piscinibacter aquaticus]